MHHHDKAIVLLAGQNKQEVEISEVEIRELDERLTISGWQNLSLVLGIDGVPPSERIEYVYTPRAHYYAIFMENI